MATEERKEKRLSEEQMVKWTAHKLAIDLADCAILENQGLLEAAQAKLKQERASFGKFRSALIAEFKIKATDDIDDETGLITKKEEPKEGDPKIAPPQKP